MRAILPKLLALTLVCALAACSGSDGDEEAIEANRKALDAATIQAFDSVEAASIALDGEGLRIVAPRGSGLLLGFGAKRGTVEGLLQNLLEDEPERTINNECGAGPMKFTSFGSLTLNFQDGEFVGWLVDERGKQSTIDGVGIGTTRAEAERSRIIEIIDGSTLGTEFSSGAINGFLADESADAPITGLYAGTNCFFR